MSDFNSKRTFFRVYIFISYNPLEVTATLLREEKMVQVHNLKWRGIQKTYVGGIENLKPFPNSSLVSFKNFTLQGDEGWGLKLC